MAVDFNQVMIVVGALGGGGLINTVWRDLFGGRKRKLDEAQILSSLGTSLRKEIREENQDLRDRMEGLVDSICALTDLVDELFPKFVNLTAEERLMLRSRIAMTRRATMPAV